MKIAIVIPAYEPDKQLISLVDALKHDYSLIIVDDGSGPNYKHIFDTIQTDNITVLQHSSNLGKGQALKTAFSHVLQHEPECMGIVTADADGQHLPADIIHTLNTLALEPEHLILGSRHFTGHIPLRSKWGNRLTRGIFSMLMGKKLIDTQTGLRGIPRHLLPALLNIKSHGYEFELEMLIYAVQHHIPITELKIATIYENNNACSHFNPLLDSAKIYFVFLRFSGLGLVTALIDLLIFTFSFMMTHNILLSECLGRGSGGLFSFAAGKHIVFKSKGSYAKELLKFFALWTTLLLTSYAMIVGAHELGLNIYLSKIITQTLLFLASFSIQRLFVFPYNPETTS
jgi:glycosyltransferase involved in cell wall biosynthesis